MSHHYFSPSLKAAVSRIIQQNQPAYIFLDKNEQPEDLDEIIKEKILEELHHAKWNRYPPVDYSEIERDIANYCSLSHNNVAIAPGSAYLVTMLLNYFAINRRNFVIAQPSYTLFDYHCRTYNISFEPWYLNPDLEFDIANIPRLTENSVLILASPNNPVGNVIKTEELEQLLDHPAHPLVIVDAVYAEYGHFDINPLILRYDNLIILRSFSKAFPAAGIRLGYMCAQEQIISTVKKLILLFSINHFTLAYARNILNNPSVLANIENRVLTIINERERLYHKLYELSQHSLAYPKKSEGNFLLVRIPDPVRFAWVMDELVHNGIRVMDTSAIKMLENSFRVSIGTTHENETFFQCMKILYS
jgi:histidinol-phosphate aminotransferase